MLESSGNKLKEGTLQEAVAILKGGAESPIRDLLKRSDFLEILRNINNKKEEAILIKGISLLPEQSRFGYLLANCPNARKIFFDLEPNSQAYPAIISALGLLTPKDYEILFGEYFTELCTNKQLWNAIQKENQLGALGVNEENHIAIKIKELTDAPLERTLFSFLIKCVFSNAKNIPVLLGLEQGFAKAIVPVRNIASAAMTEKLFTSQIVNGYFHLLNNETILGIVDAQVLQCLLDSNRPAVIGSLNTMTLFTASLYDALIFSDVRLNDSNQIEAELKSKILSSAPFYQYVGNNERILEDNSKLIILRDILHNPSSQNQNAGWTAILKNKKTESLHELCNTNMSYPNVASEIREKVIAESEAVERFLARTIKPLEGRISKVKEQIKAPLLGWVHFMTEEKQKKLTAIGEAIEKINQCHEQYKDEGRALLRSAPQGDSVDLDASLRKVKGTFLRAVKDILTSNELETSLNNHRHLHRGHVLHSPTKAMDALGKAIAVVDAEMGVVSPITSRVGNS